MGENLERCRNRVVFELRKQMLSCGSGQHTGVWHTDDVYNQLHLFTLICARKEWKSGEKLYQNAAKGPHIDLLVVGEQAEHDIGRTIESTLDVRVDDLVLEATGSKICNNNA